MKPDAFDDFLSQRTVEVDNLDATTLWSRHENYVYRASAFTGNPNFYPVFRWKDYYSFSYLALVATKGVLDLRPGFNVDGRESPLTPMELPDRDIVRLGGIRRFTNEIKDPGTFSERLAQAMIQDMRDIEALNPNARHMVLCGGKDSLNILLLPWKKMPIAVSAEPNFGLVRRFVEDNNLDIDVVELRDSLDEDLVDREIAEAACQVDLVHWRWTPHLRQIAREFDGPTIFWKGQVADATLTNFWRGYTYRSSKALSIAMRIHKRLMSYLPHTRSPLDPIIVRHLEKTLWYRAAVGQGSHVAFLRSICDALFLSAYHGPAATEVMFSADLPKITGTDLRVKIGQILAGGQVRYPETNPAPGPSKGREKLRSAERFQAALEKFGIETKT